MDIACPHEDEMRRLHLHRGILILLLAMRAMSGEVASAAFHDHPRGNSADIVTQGNTGPTCDERLGSGAGRQLDAFGSGQHSSEDTKHDGEHADDRCQALCAHVPAITSSPQPQCLRSRVSFEPAKTPLPPASATSDVLLRPPA